VLGLAVVAILALVSDVTAGQLGVGQTWQRGVAEQLVGVGFLGTTLGAAFALIGRLLAPPPDASAFELAGAFFVGATGLFIAIGYGNPAPQGPGFGSFLLAMGALPVGGVVAYGAWTALAVLRRRVSDRAVIGGLVLGVTEVIGWLVALVQLQHIAANV